MILDRINSIIHRRRDVLIEGVHVIIDDNIESWYDLLSSVLPPLSTAGLTRNLDEVYIGDDICGTANPAYHKNGLVCINSAGVLSDEAHAAILENSRLHVLTHEIIHASDSEFDPMTQHFDKQEICSSEVSFRAGKNRSEAVAEIGAGICNGYNFSQEVHDLYNDLDGPKQVYDCPKPLSGFTE